MAEKIWSHFDPKERDQAIGKVNPFLIDWMDSVGIRCGSCFGYDIYNAVQEALLAEWYRGTKRKEE